MAEANAAALALGAATSAGGCFAGSPCNYRFPFYQAPGNELWDLNRFLYSSPTNYSVGSTQLGNLLTLTGVDGVAVLLSGSGPRARCHSSCVRARLLHADWWVPPSPPP